MMRSKLSTPNTYVQQSNKDDANINMDYTTTGSVNGHCKLMLAKKTITLRINSEVHLGLYHSPSYLYTV